MSSFHGVSAAYERSFASLCAGTIPALLSALPRTPGTLLDAGCGTGDLLVQALAQGWDARGCDPDEQMVARSGQRAPGCAVLGALPDLPFDSDGFDAVTANFVINHVGRPQASVSELARVLRPSGTLAMTIWPSGAGVVGSAWMPQLADCFTAAGADPAQGMQLPTELDFPRSTDGLCGLAAQAGLTVQRAEIISWNWHVRPDDLWGGIEAGIGGAGVRYLCQTEPVRSRIREEFESRCAELLNRPGSEEGELLWLPSNAVLVTAQKP